MTPDDGAVVCYRSRSDGGVQEVKRYALDTSGSTAAFRSPRRDILLVVACQTEGGKILGVSGRVPSTAIYDGRVFRAASPCRS